MSFEHNNALLAARKELNQQVTDIAVSVAAKYASAVDKQGRFPAETLQALKDVNALSAGISADFGGLALNIIEQGGLCRILANHCASSAMVLGMHYIKTNSLNEWASQQVFFIDYLQLLVKQQRLIASMTSEEGIGGDLRKSNAAILLQKDMFSINKKSPCLSYVKEADDILLTCRVDEAASHADQRLVLLTDVAKKITVTKHWDAMGMRGTCSHACEVSAEASVTQIVNEPFASIASQTMIPDAHLLWANIWLGIAQNAFFKAKKIARRQFLGSEDVLPASARIVNDMNNKLLSLEAQINTLAHYYGQAKLNKDDKALRKLEFANAVNSLKLNASSLAKEVCLMALDVCGLAGYSNDDELSVSRNIRDVLSASVMVSNERLIEINAARLLL